MTDKELISALRGAAVETSSLLCLGCGYERSCGVHGCAIINKAAERLETLTDPPNDPLTLEQLREMDGDPVWCRSKHRPEGSGWYLVNASAQLPHEFVVIGKERGIPCAGIETGYWEAYRRKPEEVPPQVSLNSGPNRGRGHWEGSMECENPTTECWLDIGKVRDCADCPYYGAHWETDEEETT